MAPSCSSSISPATVGALPVAVARGEGVLVAYLPGLACAASPICMPVKPRRDAYIFADAARSLPHTLLSRKLGDHEGAELTMLCGSMWPLEPSPQPFPWQRPRDWQPSRGAPALPYVVDNGPGGDTNN